jgi:glycosyltransferase involved in cell wall biosynthesis
VIETTPSMSSSTTDDRALASLSVVLPCFNEVENVAAAVVQAHLAAAAQARDHEVIVVDDGSTDGTGEVATALTHTDARVRVVTHEVNRGYGAALRSGFQASRGDWVLLTDGDLQFDLGELEGLVALAGEHDLVAGYRIDRADPAGRRAAAHAWNVLVRHSFGVTLRDVDCAFKLMRGDALRALPLVSDGAMISTELVVRAQRAGWRIGEVGVHHRPRPAGEPSGGDPRVVLRAFREHRALRRALRDADRAPVPASGLAGRAPAT